jgi:hypothetical protein
MNEFLNNGYFINMANHKVGEWCYLFDSNELHTKKMVYQRAKTLFFVEILIWSNVFVASIAHPFVG